MNLPPNTPRLRSAFPATPQGRRQQNGSPTSASKLTSPLPDISAISIGREDAEGGPLIPFDTLDAPQQRLYVVAFYAALLAWRLWDYSYLQEEDTESLWLFMKWIMFDGIFLFGLPELRIPWLEFSTFTTVVLYLAHVVLNGVLMFRIPIPIGGVFAAIAKLFYDRELAINERHVKHSQIMHNSSLILGKQIIHILPEGSSILNPGKASFCLDPSNPQVYLPIQINQTTPIGIDLLRLDFDGVSNETIHITASQIKKMSKEATKSKSQHAENEPLLLRYPTKKTGMYVLQKVIDESKLEVQRRRAGDTMVVTCPKAILKPSNPNRCKGDLSDVELEVTGTPPLRIKYRKMINQVEQEAHFQSIQPEDFVSPLSGTSEALTLRNNKDISWARPQAVTVPLTEQFGISGKWVYSLEEVQDAFGNAVSYTQRDHEDQEKPRLQQAPHLHQVITVHERPTIRMDGCDSQHPLQVAKGLSRSLPVAYSSTGKGGFLDSPYEVDYLFTPENELLPNGDHSDAAQQKQITIKNKGQKPNVHLPGLYSLNGVSTQFCAGDVLEPASCLLQNPPEPSLKINKEEIFDKCANKAVGLRLDLHLTGTPPFEIKYRIMHKGDSHHRGEVKRIDGLRGQIELLPHEAGHYTYEFVEVSDSIYKNFQVDGEDLNIEQDVKPSASANFAEQRPERMVCIDQPVSFDVNLRGEGPFTLDYELIRGNSRKPFTVRDITGRHYTIETAVFAKGGEYTLALASVTDRMGCKEFLKQEAKITVRHQKPKAGFGQIEGGRSVKTLQGKKIALPLRLTGDRPWTVAYRNLRDGSEHQVSVNDANAEFGIQDEGTYELTQVHDRICPGAVDAQANKFDVSWIPRPRLALTESSFLRKEGSTYIKHDVCEGDEDAIDVQFQGAPPFEVKYEEHIRPDKGSKALRSKALRPAGSASVQLDTLQPGLVEYRFAELADYNYDHSSKHFTPVTVQQRVNPRPMARFTNPGKTYSYCTVESVGEEVIPLTLIGVPPFTIEVELKHHGSAKAEHYNFDDIEGSTFNLRVPHKTLQLGNSAVSIRKVTDARGCSRHLDVTTTPRVHIAVHDSPQIRAIESHDDFCVGDRLNFALSGQAPFTVHYTFNGVSRKATVKSTMFRRLAEKPGTFTITGVSDAASSCSSQFHITKQIHGMPSVAVSKGRESIVDIHEGSEAEITFDFGGTPPFEFTWTRSTNARKGHKSEVLEMKNEVSDDYSLSIRASEEGTYEVVSIKDRYCAYAKEGIDLSSGGGKKGGKLLTY
ncbi:hypothetical protein AAFC00_006733 [Neodothiora populina]|uniref:Ig-like domain-containing protein n=1 Tax=Neodothiora populina TaxID=2781224 RepID=A0ABR3PAZ5_9PEZI